jgi:hypothetical protein
MVFTRETDTGLDEVDEFDGPVSAVERPPVI